VRTHASQPRPLRQRAQDGPETFPHLAHFRCGWVTVGESIARLTAGTQLITGCGLSVRRGKIDPAACSDYTPKRATQTHTKLTAFIPLT
jgi:hypothetical protein